MRTDQDTRRRAFYELGAQMCGQNTGLEHGPNRSIRAEALEQIAQTIARNTQHGRGITASLHLSLMSATDRANVMRRAGAIVAAR